MQPHNTNSLKVSLEKETTDTTGKSHFTHPKGLGLCVSKECNWQRLFFLLFGMASIMSFNFDLKKRKQCKLFTYDTIQEERDTVSEPIFTQYVH